MKAMGAVFVAVFALSACAGDAGGDDVFGERACRDFHALASDAQAGVVLTPEFVERARSIYEDARLSPDVALRSAAQRLASAAADDAPTAEQRVAVATVEAACDDL